MWTFQGRNVNHVMNDALWRFRVGSGLNSDSRNGRVLRAPGPVVSAYLFPQERLVFSPTRDANHVFHLMETIWMLAGQNKVEWLLPFNSNFAQYAEDDGRQHGAYGYRWKTHFGRDQLPALINALHRQNNRRAVLQMWDCVTDLGSNAADVPCNTHAYFEVQRGALNMTVCCRSNDMIWGAYGANVVHFSMLQELLASALDVDVGTYYQFSNNFHMYLDMGPGAEMLKFPPTSEPYDPYTVGVHHFALLHVGESWWHFLDDCEAFVHSDTPKLKTEFMRKVAQPLREQYLARKAGGKPDFEKVADSDWRLAFIEWCKRRKKNGGE